MPITENMFRSKNLNTSQQDRVDVLRDCYENVANILAEVLPYDSEEKKLALIRLKESSMWAIQSISQEITPYYHD